MKIWRHLVIYRRRHGGRYVVRCFDCKWGTVAATHEDARAAIAGHQAGER